MGTPTPAAVETPPAADSGWQGALQTAIRSRDELLGFLEIDDGQIAAIEPTSHEFPLLVPRGFARRMRKRDPLDPLLRQVLPLAAERAPAPGFELDPLHELAAAADGLIRKYPGRALLITTAACPVHCRYCFRRHFPYSEQTAARGNWQTALSAIANDASIAEVILSGGDPLSLSNHRLADLIARLERIAHVTTLRIHSRYPIILPERVDSGLLEILGATQLRVVVVVHCNHPNEIDAAVGISLAALAGAGASVLNQSVLLRDINDDVDVLATLSWRLFHAGALPYYLHELDAVAGAAHFQVPHEHAQAFVIALRQRVPGYLVPRLVREIPGELGKTIVG